MAWNHEIRSQTELETANQSRIRTLLVRKNKEKGKRQKGMFEDLVISEVTAESLGTSWPVVRVGHKCGWVLGLLWEVHSLFGTIGIIYPLNLVPRHSSHQQKRRYHGRHTHSTSTKLNEDEQKWMNVPRRRPQVIHSVMPNLIPVGRHASEPRHQISKRRMAYQHNHQQHRKLPGTRPNSCRCH